MDIERLTLVLSEHSIFGWKFHVYSTRLLESGSLRILGTPDVKEEESRGSSPAIIRLIKKVNEISDKELTKAYSKKKSLIELKNEITPEIRERYIAPRIEVANRRIIELARQIGIPVFLRRDLLSNTLYEQYRLYVLPSPTKCLFNFVREEQGLRYFISLTNENREIALQIKPGIILSNQPCIVLLGNEIHCVENIEAKRLTPFFIKDYIEVPAHSEEMYLKNFVLKTLMEYEVRIQGINVERRVPSRQACLSLERDLNQEFVLSLSFRYGSHDVFSSDDNRKKIARLEDNDGETSIYWYERDMDWEKALVDKLLQSGLKQEGSLYYPLQKNEDPYQLIEWLSRKEDILYPDFLLEQDLEQRYFTGPVTLLTDFDMKIDWFEVNIVVMIGTYRIPFSRFRKHILNGNREFVLPDKTVAVLPEEWFEQYQELFRYGKETGTTLQVKKIHAPVMERVFAGHIPENKLHQIREICRIPDVHPPLPPGLSELLRPYQKEGFYWLENLYRNRFGGCLADDMGLGKTLQTIALLQHIYRDEADRKPASKPDGQLSLFDTTTASSLPASLVVAPTSLLHNWYNELRRFAPGLRIFIYAGNNRLKTKDIGKIFDKYQVVITSYGVMRNDIDYLKYYSFQMIVLDESQYIKNPGSMVYKSVKQLDSAHKLVLTGTPIENSLEDLWAQFHFINEGLLGSFNSFRKDFIQKIVKEKDNRYELLLRQMIAPFLLRRTKEEVTPELPPLMLEIVYCDMTDAQQAVYNAEKNRIRNMLMEMKDDGSGNQKNNFIALEGLNKLRQLANHPHLVMPDYAEDSGKFEQIILSFENLRASNHKVLIFSSYVRHLKLLAKKFDEEGWAYAMLTGETLKREEEIDRFMHDENVHCFFISLKAGSTGLNLTAADYVFIIDPWWNPAAEMQALGRAHRIGQEKTVIAYRFISNETVEEKILRLQEAKMALFETFVNSHNPSGQLSWEEIAGLLE